MPLLIFIDLPRWASLLTTFTTSANSQLDDTIQPHPSLQQIWDFLSQMGIVDEQTKEQTIQRLHEMEDRDAAMVGTQDCNTANNR
ncbi:hypothetical protein Ancab_006517, partial [Ancistrocladus abbreviatus]